MKRIIQILGLLLLSVMTYGQSPTLTQFYGKVEFTGFASGGTADVTGTLDNFSDQTNLYFANNIQIGDVIWDNLGRRWEVMVINSSNLLQAVVDLRDINASGANPAGVGYVSRETSTLGLSLFVPDNNIGISQQLKSRVESHNMLLIDQYLANLPAASAPLKEPYDAGLGFYCYCTPGATVTSGAQGVYNISLPDSVDIASIQKEFTNAGSDFTVGGEAVINISWSGAGTDWNTSFATAVLPDVKIIDSSGTQREPGAVSVTVQHTSVSGGTSNTTIANLNGIGTPGRIKLKF